MQTHNGCADARNVIAVGCKRKQHQDFKDASFLRSRLLDITQRSVTAKRRLRRRLQRCRTAQKLLNVIN